MAGHTPGPWLRFDNGGEMLRGHTYGPQFADVVWKSQGPGHGVIADCSPHGQAATQETVANARLIAAAPDLLAALEEIAEHPGPNADEAAHWRRDVARAAIAKATGAA